MDLPHIAVAGIVVYNDRCLFLKRKNPPLNWAPPAGRLRDNETFQEGVVREIYEETGLEVRILMNVEAWVGKPVDTHVVSTTFVCQASSDKVILSDEHSDYLWIYLSDLLSCDIDTDFNIKEWPAFVAAAQTYAEYG